MTSKTRQDTILSLLPDLQKFRLDQIQTALFDTSIHNWEKVSTLSKTVRQTLDEKVPWTSLRCAKTIKSKDYSTRKALLQTDDMLAIESVLMKNTRDQWTICVSTQVGCAMGCAFCATGKLGLSRNLNVDEIVDQVRFWQSQIKDDERISNIVVMGMGEPLMNYDNVRDAINLVLKYTDIGKTRITVSTVGIVPRMQQILTDPLWPHIRLAVSLHSVDPITRKRLMPSSTPTFLEDLATWAKEYLETFGNRRHHLTFEYLLLEGVNDSEEEAKKLARYVQKIGNVKVNLLIYNDTGDFNGPRTEKVVAFAEILQNANIDVTRRRSMGQDILAACGQLAQKIS